MVKKTEDEKDILSKSEEDKKRLDALWEGNNLFGIKIT